MERTSAIVCPHCKGTQESDIHDLVDTGDMDGSFLYNCGECLEDFVVDFEFVAMVKTRVKQF